MQKCLVIESFCQGVDMDAPKDNRGYFPVVWEFGNTSSSRSVDNRTHLEWVSDCIQKGSFYGFTRDGMTAIHLEQKLHGLNSFVLVSRADSILRKKNV